MHRDFSAKERKLRFVIRTILVASLVIIFLYALELLGVVINFAKENPTATTGIGAAVVAYFSLLSTIRNAVVKNAIDFETTYKHNEKIVNSSLLIKEVVTSKNSDEIAEYGLESNFFSEEAKAFTVVFNEWERCANGIYHGVYDEDFLYGIYGTTVLFLYERCKPYIDKRKDHNPRVYNRFSWLALRWKARRGREDRV
ncbi:DUF4760 domain-containing protein [Shewanella sp. FeAMO]